ncbi:zinc knuckle domain protein [Aspergillus saccharolyticus JOP 1030-1]|uniref:CCHC-type domain-containing protein n=1 Tax=Aspergillus saccharolyticus JOP 1030-1 TaxID=1450539 RepID=A0A319A3R1_9EURO|nr:hypothetical protein BP01DRAFT_236525 [Aspergillus saccharolyticus JOP 1030-1]PYH46768.1 hypothetical protein BP01DRAFT_236525 [Aspergillus saccharolyticus JOP 1030-1]
MSAPPSDDGDSRTAAVSTRTQSNGYRQSSQDPNPNPRKRQRRYGGPDDRKVQDFVPQGAIFSATAALEVDPDETSSSGSDSESAGTSSSEDEGGAAQSAAAAQPVSWNKGSKSAIRTSLRGARNATGENQEPSASKFDAVNDKFWRSRSASISSASDRDDAAPSKSDLDEEMEEGEVDEASSDSSSQMQRSGDSEDDSESLDSEADDSILLNIGERGPGQHLGQTHDGILTPDGDDGYDSVANGINPRSAQDDLIGSPKMSKEDAHRRYSQKYPIAPSVLADLDREDMDFQAKYRFYDRDINAIDLQLPIACTECLQEGHLADICPTKECVHCSAWNEHQSSLCPTWRRCQRCRERGHDGDTCPSALKSSASEVPCDLCGSSEHLEFDCDQMWKLSNEQVPASAPVLVSISCAKCTSNRHLIGDCPSLTRPLLSSTWTLRGIDPGMITNLNSVISSRRGGGRGGQAPGPRGMKIRGRADQQRPPSSDSDDMMSRLRQPGNRSNNNNNNSNRGHIRFGAGIGANNKNIASGGGGYRDRQRSLSPNGRPGRGGRGGGGGGRGRDSYQPPPGGRNGRPPPAPPSRPARGGGGGGGGRGGGRGGKRGGGGGTGGDAYRPLPSAGKKAWDRYRM